MKFISVDAWYIYVLYLLVSKNITFSQLCFKNLIQIYYIMEKGTATHSQYFLSRESHGQEELGLGYSPWESQKLDMAEVAEHIPYHILTMHRILESGLFLGKTYFKEHWIWLLTLCLNPLSFWYIRSFGYYLLYINQKSSLWSDISTGHKT